MSDELKRFLANARGSAAAAKVLSLDELRRGMEHDADAAATRWGLDAMRGRLVELSARGATATLTAAIELVAEAQLQSEPVAWLTLLDGTFYPPDVAESGVDLAALVVVRAPDAIGMARAAERMLRSGAFGLVVLDLGKSDRDRFRAEMAAPGAGISAEREARGGSGPAARDRRATTRYAERPSPAWSDLPEAGLPMQIQGRLVTLAQTHDAAVVCLTQKTDDTASLGSLVSLRAEALRARSHEGFELRVRALKDKQRGPGWRHSARRRGPAGL